MTQGRCCGRGRGPRAPLPCLLLLALGLALAQGQTTIVSRANGIAALFKAIPSALSKATATTAGPSATFGYNSNSTWYIDSASYSGTWKTAVANAVLAEATWLTRVEAPADASSWLLRGTVAVGPDSVTLTLTTSNALYLITDLAAKLQLSALGITVPTVANHATDSPTTTVTVTTDRAGVLQALQIGLGGTWTIGGVAQRLGVTWPLGNDVVTVSNPSVLVTAPMGSAKANLRVGLRATIPSLDIVDSAASLLLQGPRTMSIELPGTVSLFNDWATASNMNISQLSTTGFTASLAIAVPGLGISAAACTTTYTASTGTAALQIQGSFTMLYGSVAVQSLALSYKRGGAISGSASGTLGGLSAAVALNATVPASKGARSVLSWSATLPNADLGALMRSIGPAAASLLPGFITAAGTVLPVPVISTSSIAGLYNLKTGTASTGLSADLLFDQSGVVTATVGMRSTLNINTVMSALGSSVRLPSDISGLVSITNPVATVISTRAAALQASTRLPGTYVSFNLGMSALTGNTSLPAEAQVLDGAGRLVPSITIDLSPAFFTTYAGGLIGLSSARLSALSGGIVQVQCAASFATVVMNATVNVTRQSASSAAQSVSMALKASRVQLATALKDPRVWASAPTGVVSKLTGVTFPSFDIASKPTGQYYGTAGPVSGVTLAVGADSRGLRQLRLSMSGTCYTLAQAIADVGLSFALPDNTFSLCNPSVQYVPSYAGASAFQLSDGTAVAPGGSVGFVLDVPDMKLDKVPGILTFMDAAGQIARTFSLQLPGSFSVFNDWATIEDMTIYQVSRTGFTAGLNISVPDLRLTDANCTLTYTAATKTYKFEVKGRAAFVYDSVVLQSLTLTLSTASGSAIQGTATGALGGYSAATSFNFTVPASKTAKAALSLGVTLPAADLGSVMRAVGPSASALVPSFALNARMPSVRLSTANVSGVYAVKAGPTSSGISADFVFDQSGMLLGSLAMDSSLTINTALSALGTNVKLPVDVSDILTISKPILSIVSTRAATAKVSNRAPGTYMDFDLSVPALMGANTKINTDDIMIFDSKGALVPQIAISWQGSYSPVRHVTLNGASLVVQSGKGLVVSTTGTIASIPVSVAAIVADKASKAAGAKPLVITGTASRVSASAALGTLFPSTPAFVLEILKPARIATLTFVYDGSRFNVSGSPDLSAVSGLTQVMSYLGFSTNDIQIVPSNSAVQIAIQKSWRLSLSSPFVGPSTLAFGVGFSMRGKNYNFFCSASFSAALRMSIFDPTDISFTLGAEVAYDSLAPPPGVSFILTAAATSTVKLKNFPWISFSYLGGSIGLTPTSVAPFVSLRSVDLTAKANIVGNTVNAAMFWDQPKAQFGTVFNVTTVDLQKLLKELGINTPIASLGISVKDIKFSFASQQVQPRSGLTIPAGLQMAGDLSILSIKFPFSTTISTDGMSLSAKVAGLTNAGIINDVFAAVQRGIDSLGIPATIRDIISVTEASINFVMRTTKVSFAFDAKFKVAGISLDFSLNLDPSKIPWSAVQDALVDLLMNSIKGICRAQQAPNTGVLDTAAGACSGDYERRFYVGFDGVSYSYCVAPCGGSYPIDRSATSSEQAKWPFNGYKDYIRYCYKCGGIFCTSYEQSPTERGRNCGAGKVDYNWACFPPCPSGYERTGTTDNNCYQICSGKYPVSCLNGYACAASTCLAVPTSVDSLVGCRF